MKTGLIITGSGLNAAFACGVLKKWVDADVTFPHIIATGFGALTGAYFRARQGDALEALYNNFFVKYSDDLELFGPFKGEERAVEGLSLLECADEIDMASYAAASSRFSLITTRSDNGDAAVWPAERFIEHKQLMPFLKASMSFPGYAEPVPLVERSYYDGRIAEPLPIKVALEHGFDQLVVVHTKPLDTPMKRPLLSPSQVIAFKDVPRLRNVYWLSHLHYNDEMRLLRHIERQGKAIIVAPEINSAARKRYGVSMSAASEYYNEGLRLGEAALERVQAFLEANH